jgi:hypothetical protein
LPSQPAGAPARKCCQSSGCRHHELLRARPLTVPHAAFRQPVRRLQQVVFGL